MKSIKFGPIEISEDHRCFVIAEAGVNHNGSLKLAKQLISAAKECGADCVKFQTFKAERALSRNAPKARYQKENTDPNESQMEMLKKLELPSEWHKELMEHCDQHDILFLSSASNEEDVDFLADLGVCAFKFASICAVEPNLLHYAAQLNKPIFLATGMATLGEVDIAVRSIRKTGNNGLVLMQCTTNYPSRLEDANLKAMRTMSRAFDTIVGYSDHTIGDTACIVSIGLGAKVIEKHFTLDKSMPGPDHSSSSNPAEFRRLVSNIRDAEAILGSSQKEPCAAELENAPGMRRSIVAKETIRKGTIIRESMLTTKRPATGLSPMFIKDIVGRSAARNIEMDTFLSFSDVSFVNATAIPGSG